MHNVTRAGFEVPFVEVADETYAPCRRGRSNKKIYALFGFCGSDGKHALCCACLQVGSVNNTFGIQGVDKYCNYFKSVEDANRLRARISECLERASLPGTPEEVGGRRLAGNVFPCGGCGLPRVRSWLAPRPPCLLPPPLPPPWPQADAHTAVPRRRRAQERRRLLSFVVVGGGPTGVEVAAEIHDMITEDMVKLYPRIVKEVEIRIVDLMDHVLSTYDRAISNFTAAQFQRAGVKLVLNSRVAAVSDGMVKVVNKEGEISEVSAHWESVWDGQGPKKGTHLDGWVRAWMFGWVGGPLIVKGGGGREPHGLQG
eukprot:363550-Chlamydomonas_euryale.AAC.11